MGVVMTSPTALPGTNPATYSPEIIAKIQSVLPALVAEYSLAQSAPLSSMVLLDPFAGEGKIFDIATQGIWPGRVKALELEKEWARVREGTTVGDTLNLNRYWPNDTFDFIVTSPPYGTRMADDHNARDDSKRNTYRHRLGRPLSKNSSANLQWDHPQMLYQLFMTLCYVRFTNALRDKGIFILNVSDHIRGGKRIQAVRWHKAAVHAVGFELLADYKVKTRRNRQGENGDKRVPYERVLVYRLHKDRPWSADKYEVREVI